MSVLTQAEHHQIEGWTTVGKRASQLRFVGLGCTAIAGLLSIFIVPAQADTTGRATVDDGDTTEIRGERKHPTSGHMDRWVLLPRPSHLVYAGRSAYNNAVPSRHSRHDMQELIFSENCTMVLEHYLSK